MKDDLRFSSSALDTERLAPEQRQSVWRSLFTVLTVLGILVVGCLLLLPAVRTARPAGRKTACVNNLRQVALALLNYERAHGTLPPAYTVDADGKPLHSWRTLILPYLERQDLYAKIDLTKPWDDPANAEVRNTVIPMYTCTELGIPMNHTTYLAVVGPDACFLPTDGRHLSDIADGTSQTIMVIEVPRDRSVPWMCPTDADERLFQEVSSATSLPHYGGIHAAFVDGSVYTLRADLPAKVRHALISIR